MPNGLIREGDEPLPCPTYFCGMALSQASKRVGPMRSGAATQPSMLRSPDTVVNPATGRLASSISRHEAGRSLSSANGVVTPGRGATMWLSEMIAAGNIS